MEELLDWADEKGWPGMRGVLLDGGHSGKTHWSNQLACKVTLAPCTNPKPNPSTLYEP